MKNTILLLIIVLCTMTSSGQTSFFNNLENSIWISNAEMNDSIIRQTSKIGLRKISSRDSINKDVTIWCFKRDSLTIQYFDIKLKKEKLIATYKYDINKETGIFKIIFNDKSVLNYNVGIISTGSYAELTRRKIFRFQKNK